MKLKINLQHIDRTYWILFGVLIVVAVIALFSASSSLVYQRGSILGPVGGQMFFILIGIAVAFAVQFLPSWVIRPAGYLLWGFSILCLYLMLIPGSPFVITLNGAGRWFNLFGFRFQPSELAKLSLVIVVADMMSRIKSDNDKRVYFYRSLGITVATVFPVMTGNLSTAILMCMIVGTIWFLARVPWKYILTTIAIAVTMLAAGYCLVEFAFVRPHRHLGGPMARAITWVGRVDDMIEEHRQPAAEFRLTDDNYQRSIAKVAIARGGKTPIGVLPGNSQERDYLPLAYADYIFAIIVEETGILGAIFLIFLYLAILFRACLASSRYSDCAASLMVMGLALMLTCQALISMMVAVGIGPVTGQPLPMVSRGGTSVLITALYFGIMMCVSREQKELSERASMAREESMNTAPIIEIEE